MSFALAKLSARARAGSFSIWSYDTADDLPQLLDPGYFSPAAGILRPTDLLFSSCTAGGTRRTVLLRVVAVEDGAIQLDPVRDPGVASLADLGDVAVQLPQLGDVLKFDGAAWTGSPEAGARGDAFAEMHATAGGDAHPLARADGAGFMSAADKAKLDGIELGASADQSGTEIVAALDAALQGSNWRRDDVPPHAHAAADLAERGDFYGRMLGASLVVDGERVGVDPAVLSRARAITAPEGEDPTIGLELPAAMDRRDFLLGFTAAGAVTTTKVATAKEVDAVVAQAIRVVPAMEDLATRRGGAGETVWLRGYRTPNDGGEGFFTWDPTSTVTGNGGTIVAPDSSVPGRWKRAARGPWVNVRWFGIVGDGKVDDTEALVAALRSAVASGATLFVPSGTAIRFTRNLEVPTNARIVGAHGRAFSSALRPDGAQILFDGQTSAGALTGGAVFNAAIEDIMIWPLHSQPLAATILFRDGYSNRLENVRIHNAPDHITIHIRKTQNDLKLNNIVIYGNKVGGGNCDLIVTEEGTSTKLLMPDLESGRYAIHHKGGGLDVISPYIERCYSCIRFDNGNAGSLSNYISVYGGQVHTDASGVGWAIYDCTNVNVFGTQLHQSGQWGHYVYGSGRITNANFWGSDPAKFAGNVSKVNIWGFSGSSPRLIRCTNQSTFNGGGTLSLFRMTSSSSLASALCRATAWGQVSNGAGSFYVEKTFMISGSEEVALNIDEKISVDGRVFVPAASQGPNVGFALLHKTPHVELALTLQASEARTTTVFSRLEVEVSDSNFDVKLEKI